MADLTGKSCFVTGGSRGIGREIALELGRHGGSVAVGYHSDEVGHNHEEQANEVTAEIAAAGGQAFAFGCDVRNPASIESAVASVVEHFGNVDVLVNNAGITRDRSLAKMSQDEWDAVLETNLSSVFHVTSRVLPHMVHAGYGRIVNISSVVGLHGNYGQANYAAAKAGIVGFTKTAALELASKGVTVNAIAPGFIATQMIAAMPDDVRARILEKIPMGRFGRPEEIAQLVAFLVTKGEYITGQVIAIDGGLYT
jgi:3-oxoacyl-(acyl-carrier-protein) reductase